jgi:uncharacterized protein
MMALPFSPGREGVNLAVRVAPRAARDRVLGLAPEAGGGVALKLAIHAPPEDGQANVALLRLLADHFGLRKDDLSLTAGASGRRKLVHIAGDPAVIGAALERGLRPWLTPG